MKHKFFYAAAIIGLALLCSQGARADPMRCSDVKKTCLADCNKNPDRNVLTACVTNCGARQAICAKTGCWNSGTNRFCNLMRQ